MRILHISKYYDPYIGGIEQVAKDVVNVFKGHEQKIICFNHESGTKIDKTDDIEITRVGCEVKISSQSIALRYGIILKKLINNFVPDIVIFHYPNPYVAHFLLKHRKKNFKLITYWHLDITKQKILGKLFNNQNKKIIKMSNRVVAATPIHFETSKYSNYFGDKKVVIPFAVDIKRLYMSEEEMTKSEILKQNNKDKINCFFIGRHVPYKGLEYLIKASKLLDDRFKFYIAGSGPLTESLKELAKDDHKVEFLGRISDSEYRIHLEACDIFCFPSITRNEAFGLAQAEAMYYKKPVVTFYIYGSGVNYVNMNNVTGLEANNCDFLDYAKKLNELADSKELRVAYGEAGYKRVLEEFSLESFELKTSEVLEELFYENSDRL